MQDRFRFPQGTVGPRYLPRKVLWCMSNLLDIGHFFTYFTLFICKKAVKMLKIAIFLSIFAILLYFYRKMMIKYLSVSSRDVRALYGIRGVLRLLWADENLAVFDPSKDRGAYIPGESRRKKVKPKLSGREAAMQALKHRLKRST